jgi:hypothetical protein
VADITSAALPKSPAFLVAAFTLNEMAESSRSKLLERLLARGRQGDRLLIVEPVARFVAPWWDEWSDRIIEAGGRADEWRFTVELPEIVRKLDVAAGLDHRQLTARSFWV